MDLWSSSAARVLAVSARARRKDPQTSHEAATKLNRAGKTKAQAEAVLAAVKRFPGHTSSELAGRVGLDRYQVARRLPELRKAGLVSNGQQSRPCEVTGFSAMTWYPV